jgi:hypothetical protein
MKNLKYISLLILFLLPIISCDDGPPTDSNKYPINPYLKEIKFSNPNKKGNFYMAVWRDNTIFAIQPLSKFIIDNNFDVIQDTILESTITVQKPWTYIDANSIGSKILLVETHRGGVSAGALYEFDVSLGQLQLLYDNSRNIASARYYPNDDSKIIYYSFGDSQNIGAGYYLKDNNSGTDTLLFPYLSTAGWWETLHGFDIHPNGDTLLIPISLSVGQFNLAPPKLGKASIKDQRLDTLDIEFDMSFVRTGLYVRYNNVGSKILYCCFPFNAYGFVTNDNSEVGIIESTTLHKIILNINTNGESGHGSVQLAPNWSPDETAIVFGSGQVISTGQAGFRHLFILTRLN